MTSAHGFCKWSPLYEMIIWIITLQIGRDCHSLGQICAGLAVDPTDQHGWKNSTQDPGLYLCPRAKANTIFPILAFVKAFTLAPIMAQNWMFWHVLVSRVIMRSLIFSPAAGIKLICNKCICSKIAQFCTYRQPVKTKNRFFVKGIFLGLVVGNLLPQYLFADAPPVWKH